MKRIIIVQCLCVPFFVLFFFLSFSVGSDSYFPLSEGMTWKYNISIDSMLGGQKELNFTIINFPSRELEGKEVTPRKTDIQEQIIFDFVINDANGIYSFADQGHNELEPKIRQTQTYYIKYPIKVGTTWEEIYKTNLLAEKVSVTTTSIIESIDDVVTVSAGTFEKCLKIKSVGHIKKTIGVFGVVDISIEQYNWYAPGVGFVKEIAKEMSNNLKLGGGTITGQLESFNKVNKFRQIEERSIGKLEVFSPQHPLVVGEHDFDIIDILSQSALLTTKIPSYTALSCFLTHPFTSFNSAFLKSSGSSTTIFGIQDLRIFLMAS